MTSQPLLTDTAALARNRIKSEPDAMFLQALAADEAEDRLTIVNKRFTKLALVTGHPIFWANVFPETKIVSDSETIDLGVSQYDLVLHMMSLHWANDPVGQLIQCRRALQPDGLFLATCFGGQTLNELRACLAQAETEITGGLSPRVAPMAELRDLGGLLQRAGFALPVADSVTQKVEYKDIWHLMRDLRKMGEGNALATRLRKPTRRRVFEKANELYQAHFAAPSGTIIATFELIFLTGWAPDATQPKPLRPGSAQQRLADVLATVENPLKD